MSDPIADILTNLAISLIDSYNSAPATGYSYDPSAMIIDDAAKQIRQQIGLELLEKETIIESKGINNGYSINYVSSYRIREVCQLEES